MAVIATYKPLNITTKRSILDVAVFLDFIVSRFRPLIKTSPIYKESPRKIRQNRSFL